MDTREFNLAVARMRVVKAQEGLNYTQQTGLDADDSDATYDVVRDRIGDEFRELSPDDRERVFEAAYR